MSQATITTAPEGFNSVNPVIISSEAEKVIAFLVDVFGGAEDEGARTYDEDGTIFHSEVMIDTTKFIVAERKEGWPFTPAFNQLYVTDVTAAIERAKTHGTTVITEPTDYVGVTFSRVQDAQGNIWWIWKTLENYDWEAAFAGGDEESWKPTKEAMYVHDTLVETMEKMAKN